MRGNATEATRAVLFEVKSKAVMTCDLTMHTEQCKETDLILSSVY